MKNIDLSGITFYLNQLLQYIRKVTSCDAGTIYLRENNYLKFMIFQNDTVSQTDLNNSKVDVSSIKLYLDQKKYNLAAVESFLQSKIINISDVYNNNEFDLTGTKQFDTMFNYKTHSILTIPLKHPTYDIAIGVLQIINKKDGSAFCPFNIEDTNYLVMIGNFVSMIIANAKNHILEVDKMSENIDVQTTKNNILFQAYNTFQINDVITNISHQWRQPLGELGMNNFYLSTKIKDPALLEVIKNNDKIIQQISKTIDNFELVFDDEKKLEQFILSDLVELALIMLGTEIKKYNLSLELKLDSKIVLLGQKNIFTQFIIIILKCHIQFITKCSLYGSTIKIDLFTDKNDINLIIYNYCNQTCEYTINKELFDDINSFGLNMFSSIIKEKYNGKFIIEKDLDKLFLCFSVSLPDIFSQKTALE